MLFCTLQFLVVLTVAPKYGLLARWLRLRNLSPQQIIEDILTTVLRYDKPTPLSVIRQYVESPKGLKKPLQRMIEDGLLQETAGGYGLTPAGDKEANKVLKAHRLWEAYLETIGTPKEELHPTAHQLEHISDTNTVKYLGEKLGKPQNDQRDQEKQ